MFSFVIIFAFIVIHPVNVITTCIINKTSPPKSSSMRDGTGIVFQFMTTPCHLFFFLHFQFSDEISTPLLSKRNVTTRYGQMKGLYKRSEDERLSDVEAYLGIKYASIRPGNDSLRFFQPPVPPNEHSTWVKPFIKFKPVCPQVIPDLKKLKVSRSSEYIGFLSKLFGFIESQQIEECLNLNIYIPVKGRLGVSFFLTLFVFGTISFIG